MKKIICVLAVAVMLLSLLSGCNMLWDVAGSTAKTYSTDDLTLELPANMMDLKGDDFEEYDMVYANDKFGIFLLKEPREDFADYDPDLDVQGYAELMTEASREVSDAEPVLSRSAAGNPVITYEATVDGETFSYYTVLLGNDEAFFSLQFYCGKDKFEELLADFETYEATITLKE